MNTFRDMVTNPVTGLALGLLLAPVLLMSAARAEVTFEIIGEFAALDISADGSVVCGNTNGVYETCIWTAEGGLVPLGRATVPVFGSGAGTPDISDDGTRVSATITGGDDTYITQGVWIEGVGWVETMPPTLPDGGLMDNAYGSAWGLSGDGMTLVGLYWRPGATDGSAHASTWSQATGIVSLGSLGRDSRANDANHDGSVVVGWVSNPDFGNWWPAVWVEGVLTVLSTADWFCQATAVTPDGSMVLGYDFSHEHGLRAAAAWRWNAGDEIWEEEILGSLPGTHPDFGLTQPEDVTADGSTVVGYHMFSNPFFATGFIWTAETGLIDVEDFLADHDVDVPAGFNILTLTGISMSGTCGGIGCDLYFQSGGIFQFEGLGGVTFSF
jgi:uncharacterized membrane protein